MQRIRRHISLRQGAALAAAWLVVLGAAPAAAWQPETRLARLGGFGSGTAVTGRALIESAEHAHRRGHERAAIALATRAIETDSLAPEELTRALRFRAQLYRETGADQRAMADYDALVELNPQDAVAFLDRVYRRTEQLDRAIADCSRAIELDLGSELHWAYTNRGWAHLDKQLYDLAIADYGMAIALKPDYARAYYGRGRALQAKGEGRQAALDYRRASEIEPDNRLYRAAGIRGNALAVMLMAAAGLIGAYAFGTSARRRGWRRAHLSLAVLAGFLLGAGAGLLSAGISLFV